MIARGACFDGARRTGVEFAHATRAFLRVGRVAGRGFAPAAGGSRHSPRRSGAEPQTVKAVAERSAVRGKRPTAGRGGGGGRSRKRRTARRSLMGRLFVWAVTLGVWGMIGVAGLVGYYFTKLPPIDQLAVPKRAAQRGDPRVRRHPPRQSGRDGRAHRRAFGIAGLCAEGLRRHRGSALLPSFRHRSARPRACRGDHALAARPWRRARRLDADPAARQEPVPDARAYLVAQDPGGDPGGLARAQIHEEPDPRALPQPRLFRLRRLWHRGGGAALFLEARPLSLARRSRDARRRRPGARRLAPNRNPDAAEKRAEIVIADMRDQGFISDGMAKVALAHPAQAIENVGGGAANFAADYVMDAARREDRRARGRHHRRDDARQPPAVPRRARSRRGARCQGRQARCRRRARSWRFRPTAP